MHKVLAQVSTLSIAAALGALSAVQPMTAVAILLVGLIALLDRLFDVWPALIVLSVTISVLRSGAAIDVIPTEIGLLLQFGPLVILTCLNFRRTVPERHSHWSRLALWSLWGLALLALSSTMWSIDPAESQSQALLFLVVVVFLSTTLRRRWTTYGVAIRDISVVYWTLSLLQLAGLAAYWAQASWTMGYFGRFQGLFSNPNYAGMVAAIAIPFALDGYLRAATPVSRMAFVGTSAAHLIVMIMSGSRGATAAALVGAVVVMAGRSVRRKTGPIALSVAALGVAVLLLTPALDVVLRLFSRTDKHAADFGSGRFEIWHDLIGVWQDNPLTGIGYRTTSSITGENSLEAHNILLAALVEMGPAALCLLLLLFASAARNSPRPNISLPLRGAVAAIFVVEMTESSLFGFGGPAALFCWVIVMAGSVRFASSHEPIAGREGGRPSSPLNEGLSGGIRQRIPAHAR